jgi:nucleotide-binding universal stress UspA family protein
MLSEGAPGRRSLLADDAEGWVLVMGGGRLKGIVCAIRGGSASRVTVAVAINLAREKDLPLCFLHVVSGGVLLRGDNDHLLVVSEQVRQAGEAALSGARILANDQSVEAQTVLQHGDVGNEIVRLCDQVGAVYLVLGHPQRRRRVNAFAPILFKRLVKRVQEQTEASVVVVGGNAGADS